MEHEVFVPVPAERLREALADPARVAGAVPGLQQEAGAEPVTGRLKIRVGSHSVTYRGTVRFTARDDGTYAAEGEAVEARGTGTVTVALTVRVARAGGGGDAGAGGGAGGGADGGAGGGAGGGATLTFAGTATVTGRLTELPPDAVTAAVTRLLTRFGQNLGQAAQRDEPAPSVSGTEVSSDPEREGTADRPPAAEPPAPEPPAADQLPTATDEPPTAGPSAEPPTADPSAGPTAEPPTADPSAEPSTGSSPEPPADPLPDPPAEAAHARRTMIGRSAEEVDHAPPRGRYAPVPAPQAASSGTPLRWAAPAAALVVASAIVVGRALRRRR
ncbi:hypothetical protein SUDANB145_03500 [Streptomyces sp. enrichment culture]|uniref:carbon monoxide dehydrogenase subunit G n=1 Tax=Streptomyces sp. enrichment culture TaxID=1795815 RepID=UPI003F54A9E3